MHSEKNVISLWIDFFLEFNDMKNFFSSKISVNGSFALDGSIIIICKRDARLARCQEKIVENR